MITERDVDQFEAALRDFVRGLVAFDQGHRVTESLEAARQNFRDALKNALGARIRSRARDEAKESAE